MAAARYLRQPWTRSHFGYDRFRGRRVLEIGIGHGTDLLRFARAGAVCHGVDITDRHLAPTRRNFELHCLQPDLHKVDTTWLPFDDASLDCVYSFGVLNHIRKIEAVIAEVRRVLLICWVIFGPFDSWEDGSRALRGSHEEGEVH